MAFENLRICDCGLLCGCLAGRSLHLAFVIVFHVGFFKLLSLLAPLPPPVPASSLLLLPRYIPQVRPEELKDMDGMRKRCPLEVRASFPRSTRD